MAWLSYVSMLFYITVILLVERSVSQTTDNSSSIGVNDTSSSISVLNDTLESNNSLRDSVNGQSRIEKEREWERKELRILTVQFLTFIDYTYYILSVIGKNSIMETLKTINGILLIAQPDVDCEDFANNPNRYVKSPQICIYYEYVRRLKDFQEQNNPNYEPLHLRPWRQYYKRSLTDILFNSMESRIIYDSNVRINETNDNNSVPLERNNSQMLSEKLNASEILEGLDNLSEAETLKVLISKLLGTIDSTFLTMTNIGRKAIITILDKTNSMLQLNNSDVNCDEAYIYYVNRNNRSGKVPEICIYYFHARGLVDLRDKYNEGYEPLYSLLKKKIHVKRAVTDPPTKKKDWKAKKEEFFRKHFLIFDATTDGSHNETFQEIQKSVEGILEGFSIEGGNGEQPTTLKMSKKWKPVVERFRRGSGDNQTEDPMLSEEEERLSLSQEEKVVLEEALDRIISAIITHRNDLMTKTRRFVSLVVHILAKSEKMEPEALSCIARAGVTFMSETRKHLNTVFKGFRAELESMKKTLWSEESVDGSDKDETITKLISAELMRDVEDAIAASSRTYEVNKVRLFEKFMTCKISNSA